ncbi:MAG: GNAT family N-acetyltransferase [Chloroflexota bacterium]|nr:GNAT family N-acetyltransferase [Chloroflexota bacterium]
MTTDKRPTAGGERCIAPLDIAQDPAAARLLAGCVPEGSAATWLTELRATEGVDITGLEVAGELVGVSATRRVGMTMELTLLVVAAAARRRGHGKELLIEALLRAGRRPTVAEVREEDLPFYQAMRFKLVGRRRQPDGSFRYRLGWHPPGQRAAPAGAAEATDDQ